MVSNEKVDALLVQLDSEARDVDCELGLPLMGAHQEALREIVRNWLGLLESSSSAHVHSFNEDLGVAVCACGHREQGWFCAQSPTKLCRYDNGDRDSCDFCGQPEERA